MTISSETSRMNYTGNGSTETYAYTYRIFDENHILATVQNIATSVETTLVIGTDYTVTGVLSITGGNVVLVDSGQAWLDDDGYLPATYTLSLRRVLPLTQPTDIRNQGSFFPETHEDQFDRIIMQIQQQQDVLDRSIRFPETFSEDIDTTLPSPSAGLAIGWNATEDGLVNIASAGTLSVSAFGETLLDDTTAAEARATLGIAFPVNAIHWDNSSGGPVEDSDNSAKVFIFEDGLAQNLTAFIRVPQLYIAGRQITMRFMHYHKAASATQLISGVTTLLEPGDAIDNTTDQYTSTNTAQTGADKVLCQAAVDLTSGAGAINSVAVAPGDLLKVVLARGTDTSVSDLYMIQSSVEVTF